jgi:hypothetical protein
MTTEWKLKKINKNKNIITVLLEWDYLKQKRGLND